MNAPRARNTETVGLIVAAVFALLGLAGMFGPPLAGLDGMDGGFALQFSGFFSVIIAIVITIFYAPRVRILHRILTRPDELLAHWRYDDDEWQRHLADEYTRDQAAKRSLFWLVVVIMAVIGAIFFIADPEAGVWVVAVLAGTALLMALVAFVLPALTLRRRLRNAGEARISSEGLYVGGQFHIWNRVGTRLEKVALEGEHPVEVVFTITYFSRFGREAYEVRVPVPPGEQAAAEQVVARLKKRRSSS